MVIGIDASRAFETERTGTENYSYHLITQMLGLPTAKKHTFVLFIRPNAVIPQELAGYSNVKIIIINQKYLWTQLGLARQTWVQNLDVLWIGAHTLPILRKPHLNTVVTIHGLEYKWLPEYNNWLQRWYLPLSTFYAAKAANRLICVSQATKRDLLREVRIDIEKISVILEGAELERKNAQEIRGGMSLAGHEYGLERGKYALFVGTVQPRKNVGALIGAFAKFYKKHKDYRLVVAGGIGWQAERDLTLPEEFQIPEAVIFTGRTSQAKLQALYLGAGVLVQPSWTEGFGLPVVEAMRAKVPVIASDGGALPEVVGEAGMVVPLNMEFEANLVNAMERVMSDKKLRERLIARGLNRAKELTWKRAAEKTLSVLVGERS